MLYSAGRTLQMIGLIVLPVGIAGNVAERLDLRQSLTVAGVGVAIFAVGWMLQEWGKG